MLTCLVCFGFSTHTLDIRAAIPRAVVSGSTSLPARIRRICRRHFCALSKLLRLLANANGISICFSTGTGTGIVIFSTISIIAISGVGDFRRLLRHAVLVRDRVLFDEEAKNAELNRSVFSILVLVLVRVLVLVLVTDYRFIRANIIVVVIVIVIGAILISSFRTEIEAAIRH